MIILIPALAGGIWQLFELSSISFSFIRFFSTSQIIADGIIILSFLFAIFLAQKISMYFMEMLPNMNIKILQVDIKKPTSFKHSLNPNKSNKLEYIDNKIYTKKSLIITFIIFICGTLIFLLLYKNNPELISFDKNNFRIFPFLNSLLTIVLIANLYIHFVMYITMYLAKEYGSTIFGLSLRLISNIFFFIAIIIIIWAVSFLRDITSLPKNFVNLKQIENSFIKGNIKNSKILYFNDKYIFVEHERYYKEKTIQVIKFDDLFNNN